MNIRDLIIRQHITSRGGGIEIALDQLGYEGHRMTAYQNYLGGGILGRICNDCTLRGWESDYELKSTAFQLSQYLHSLTNPEDDYWNSMTFDQNQLLPSEIIKYAVSRRGITSGDWWYFEDGISKMFTSNSGNRYYWKGQRVSAETLLNNLLKHNQ